MINVYKIVLATDAAQLKEQLEETGVSVSILPYSQKGLYQPHFRKLQIRNGLPFGSSLRYIRVMESLTDRNVFYEGC